MPPTQTAFEATFIEREPYEKGFAEFFDKYIKEKLTIAEQQRFIFLKEYQKRKKWAFFGYIVLIAVTIFFLYLVQHESVFGYAAFIAIAIYAWTHGPISKYRSHVKEGIIRELVKFFGTLTFNENEKISGEILRESNIVPVFTDYTGTDHIAGEYDTVAMEMCEVQLEKEGAKNKKHIIFRGEIFHIKMKKPFTGRTVVKKDGGLLGGLLSRQFTGSKPIKLEDPKFEDIFNVHSDDQIEARYLLTTAFMERLLNLKDAYNKNGTIQCEFFKDHLLIMVATEHDLFEAGPIEKSCLDTEDTHRFLSQMHSVFQVIEVLKLNKYTGL